ncbi:MAG: thioredoxin-disulfide reductase [Clostridia bacterium]|nr:thioredoxin-disulfide reductase [Clostridia bacterium]
MYDIIIIGAGPAGLTAAIYARRAEKSVLLIEKGAFGGQVTFSPKIENYPGFGELTGTELAEKMVDHAITLGAEFQMETVTAIKGGDIKTVITDEGEYEAKAVIIATGAQHRHLGVEGEEQYLGNGISFCAVCDGAFYKDQTVTVIGGGNSALQEAILLAGTCKKVTVVQNLPYLTGEEALQKLLKSKENVEIICSSVVTSFTGDGALDGIKIKNTETGEESLIPCDGCFVAIGLIPATDFIKELVALDNYGYVDANENCRTDIEGVFVAGDCRKKEIRQITTATADGAAAALSAIKYIDR